ncbi:antibiotic biosynthesis monooxygenase family protein [Aquisediminimonas sediminicola]|uniref:antibiotic biosynthesis monooxygenase family protein n=1 Tax=Alteraquisediminimonas sediminicola TaxID=2676787 RepID=UPI001C8D3CEC|nr:antibiotic biosynthesis monooxygenase family protein [Aquisediminimonas sediminicola]
MIIEIALITIDPTQAHAFEHAVAQARDIFQTAEGCRGMRLERMIEDPAKYMLRIQWDSLEHHMVTFRNSEGFQAWRALASPFFVAAPVVEHSREVLHGF